MRYALELACFFAAICRLEDICAGTSTLYILCTVFRIPPGLTCWPARRVQQSGLSSWQWAAPKSLSSSRDSACQDHGDVPVKLKGMCQSSVRGVPVKLTGMCQSGSGGSASQAHGAVPVLLQGGTASQSKRHEDDAPAEEAGLQEAETAHDVQGGESGHSTHSLYIALPAALLVLLLSVLFLRSGAPAPPTAADMAALRTELVGLQRRFDSLQYSLTGRHQWQDLRCDPPPPPQTHRHTCTPTANPMPRLPAGCADHGGEASPAWNPHAEITERGKIFKPYAIKPANTR